MSGNRINSGLYIHEPSGGIRFGTDALLLSYFSSQKSFKKAIDLGTGSGVIPLLVLSRTAGSFSCIEIQEDYCNAAKKNAAVNNLSDRMTIIHGDLKEIKSLCLCGDADLVVTNPPYHRVDSGKRNLTDEKYIAYHEVKCNINDICRAASWCLGTGGNFYAVYLPERLPSLLCSMRENKIEPKWLRLVSSSAEKPPSLVLVRGQKDGNEGMKIDKSFYIYTDSSNNDFSDEMKTIYEFFG